MSHDAETTISEKGERNAKKILLVGKSVLNPGDSFP
jgi:hypothetical protein